MVVSSSQLSKRYWSLLYPLTTLSASFVWEKVGAAAALLGREGRRSVADAVEPMTRKKSRRRTDEAEVLGELGALLQAEHGRGLSARRVVMRSLDGMIVGVW